MKRLILILLPALALAQSFPTSIYTPLVAANNVQTKLSAPMAAGDNVAIVASSTGWTANMLAYICDATTSTTTCTGSFEIMRVDNVNGNVLTVTRGAGVGGTSAIAHAAGKALSNSPVATYNKVLSDEVLALETAIGAGVTGQQGNGAKLQRSTGAPAANDCAKFDAAGNTVDAGAPCNSLPAATKQLQQLRVKPNQGNLTTFEFAGPTIVNAADYAFAAISPSGTLGAGNNTVTFPVVPLGLNGSDIMHYVYVAGTGTPEACLVNGGGGVAGQVNGQVVLNCANVHSAGYTVQSAGGGIPEALQAIASTGGSVFVPSGTVTLYQTISFPAANLSLVGAGRDAAVLQAAAGTTFHTLVSAASYANVAVQRVTIDGNFINRGSATYENGIDGSGASNFAVTGCRVKYIGYGTAPNYDGTGYPNSGGIRCQGCPRAQLDGNLFASNFAADIIGSGDGAVIRDNQHGVPDYARINTAVNYWDLQAGGVAGTFWTVGTKVQIVHNQYFGAIRFYNSPYLEGNPIVIYPLSDSDISDNTIEGMQAGYGTCTVTTGSPAVSCANSAFSSTLDTNSQIEFSNQAGTLYRISAVGSATSITLTTNFTGASASNLKYKSQFAGDGIQANGPQGSRISRNSIANTGDMGLDVIMYWDGNPADNVAASFNVVTDNVATGNRTCGINIGGQAQGNLFTGNIVRNNHQGTNNAPEASGGFCLGGTPDNVHYYTLTSNIIANNVCIDTQGGSATQTYCIGVNALTASGGYLGFNTYGPNIWSGGTAMWNVAAGAYNPATSMLPAGIASGPLLSNMGVANENGAGAITYSALEMVNGMVLRAPGGDVSDVTPTAAQLIAQVNGAINGTGFYFYLRNTGGVHVVTVTGGANVAISGTATVAQNFQRGFMCQITSIAAPGAVTCYSMGTAAF